MFPHSYFPATYFAPRYFPPQVPSGGAVAGFGGGGLTTWKWLGF